MNPIEITLSRVLVTSAKSKVPSPEKIENGEIAINYNKNHEGLYIKNDAGEIVDLSRKDIIDTKVDKIDGKGLSTNDFTNEDKSKLAMIDTKVDKIDGKGLSTNDFTNEDKAKLDGINLNDVYNSILNKIMTEYPDLRKSEIVYEYTGDPVGYGNVMANFDSVITVNKNWADYDYLEVFCKTNDGWNLTQKLNNPDGQVLSFASGNVTSSGYLSLKVRAFEFANGNVKTIATTFGTPVTLAGEWLSKYNTETGTNEKATNSDSMIGIAKIIGYRK